jgi:hypothetical protein
MSTINIICIHRITTAIGLLLRSFLCLVTPERSAATPSAELHGWRALLHALRRQHEFALRVKGGFALLTTW